MVIYMDNLPAHLQRRWFRTAEAAEYLEHVTGVPHAPATLEGWRVRPPKGGGPEFHKVGRCVTYYREQLDRFAQRRVGAPITSTSEAGHAHL
ncbi:hypothetical protein [Xanthobacter wiegelii]|uniref:hypothetical protein n=1 Tax=Xanthobacter wiegelii TaxID=3119913 RepID=UPI00372BDCBB